jgi:hypothetical protein
MISSFINNNDDDNNLETCIFNGKQLIELSEKPIGIEIKNFIKYIINTLLPNIDSKIYECTFQNFYIIIKKLLTLNINRFLLISSLWLLTKVNKIKKNFIVYENILYYFILCFAIIEKFINDNHYGLKSIGKFLNFSTKSICDQEVKLLILLDYNINLKYDEIQTILNEINNI